MRASQSSRRPLRMLLIGLSVLILGGALALAALPTPRQQSTTITPAPSHSSSAVTTPSTTAPPSTTPVVAGTQDSATPQPSPAAASNTASAPASAATPAPESAPTPIPERVYLTIVQPDTTLQFTRNLTSGLNPCSILAEVKTAGLIHSLTIVYYGAPLHSDYVEEINGHRGYWTFKVNGNSPPTGCSHVPLQNGDNITWRFN